MLNVMIAPWRVSGSLEVLGMIYSFMARFRFCYLMCMAGTLTVSTAHADPGSVVHDLPTRQEAAQVNKNSIGIVYTHEHLYYQVIHNIDDQMEIGSDLRIVPIMGKSHVQSVYDLLYLKGVDLALLRADAIEYVKRKGNFPGIQGVLRSLVKISDEKVVILARDEYQSIDDLAGESVGFGGAGSGGFVTGSIIFESLGINVTPLEGTNSSNFDKLKSGELAAMVYMLSPEDSVAYGALETRKRVRNLKSMDNIRVLPLPQDDELLSIYQSAILSNDDLPGLVAEKSQVDTYSVDAILVAYRWRTDSPRYKKLSRFVKALLDNLDALKSEQYMPAWQRVDPGHQTPNVARSALVDWFVERREQAALAVLENEKKRIAAEKEAARASKIAEVIKQREEITARLGEKMSNADAVELERLLSQLGSFLEELENAEPDGEDK